MPLRHDPLLQKLEPLQKLRSHPALGYAVAVVSVIAATLVRRSFPEALSSSSYATFFAAVVITSLVGSFRAGLLSVALSLVAVDYFFMPPVGSFTWAPRHIALLVIAGLTFTLIAAAVSTLQTLVDRLRKQESNLRSVLDAEPVGVAVLDQSGVVTYANGCFEKAFGYPGGLAGRQIGPLLPDAMPEIHAVFQDSIARRIARRPAREMFALRKNGTQFPVEITLAAMERHDATVVLLTLNDLTDRKIADRTHEALLREVQHRSRNVLAMVEAITTRTLSAERPIKEARAALLSTLATFRRTHEVLTSGARVTLKDIVESELAAFHGGASVHGDELRLAPSAAMNMSMIIHELCTNAAKYGALSLPQGKVLVEWQVTNGVLAFSWIEVDGPAVRQPERTGFGSTLLHELPRSWGANARMEFTPQGLIYTMLVDERTIAEKETAARVA